MRVIAGTARSLRLETPEGMDTRPTTDRIKETLFNMLQFDLQEAVFLDLFAGSGAIGIEALSRGAREAVFVDNSREAYDCITQNLTHTHFSEKGTVYKQDVFTALSMLEYRQKFDIVFMDPPYHKELEQRVLEYFTTSSLVDKDTLIIFEAALDTSLDFLDILPYEVQKIKRYKTNMHIFVKGVINMKAAIYPGSFDPVTYGHLDVIRRSANIFDRLTVSVLNNVGKSALFSVEERVKMLEEATKDLPNVTIDSFSGLLIDYAKKKNVHVVIRGLRAITDFEYELQIAQTNHKLSGGELDTMFLTTSLEYAYLSSSSVKEIAYFNGDITPCVPDFVAKELYRKYHK